LAHYICNGKKMANMNDRSTIQNYYFPIPTPKLLFPRIGASRLLVLGMIIKDFFFFPSNLMNCFHHLFVLSPAPLKALNKKKSKIFPTSKKNLLIGVTPYCSLDIKTRNKGNENEVPSNTTLIFINANNTNHLHEFSLSWWCQWLLECSFVKHQSMF